MTKYVSCTCNSVPHCVDWGDNGLICFATCKAIAIYEPGTHIGRITHTLHHHHDCVALHWIKPGNDEPESELLCAFVDGTVIIWSKDDRNNTYEKIYLMNIGNNITFADSLQLSDISSTTDFRKLLICICSINGELKIWSSKIFLSRNKFAEVEEIQTISFNGKLLMYCRLTYFPNTKCPFLAVALEDASVSLYIKDSNVPNSSFIEISKIFSGHENWIRCMDFCHDGNGNVFLATGAQDSMIELWKISKADTKSLNTKPRDLKNRNIFIVNNIEYEVILESILSGHEGWIYGVHWQPIKTKNGDNCPKMRLLSASFDKSMIIWESNDTTGLWIDIVRVGKVGGNSLGFYNCKFDPNGLHILGYGYQGSFHIWKYCQETANWIPRSAPSGHFSEVVDLCWEPKGRFLITASTDQTTRIHAPWNNGSEELWHEIARPQIHGYNMSCLVMLTPYIYVSGAEEKVIRVFSITKAFINRLKLLMADVTDFKSTAAHGATVPSLGLTNKATINEEIDQCENEENPITNNSYEPPTEEELVQNTLWPELQKLYGHGYEIFCMAARHDGRLLATACKSTNQEHSAIILWSTDMWLQVQKLVSHKLTVTQMQFSQDDMYLLSVSRDRRWSLFKYEDERYKLLAASSKTDSVHLRLIWCCAWTHDSNYFATGSRDGKIGIWSKKMIEDKSEEVLKPIAILDTQSQAVTALCFAPNHTNIARETYVLAIGYNIGWIEIKKITMHFDIEWTTLIKYNTFQAHHLTVKRLMFRPSNDNSSNIVQLASCGSDHSVKIYDINLSPDKIYKNTS